MNWWQELIYSTFRTWFNFGLAMVLAWCINRWWSVPFDRALVLAVLFTVCAIEWQVRDGKP